MGSPRDRVHVVFLAAGRGTRLGALMDDKPKWLLEVGDRPIADRQLEALERVRRAHPGAVASARVITGHARGAVESYLEQRGADDVQVVHNAEYARLNNWYSVLLALRSIANEEERVVIINSDLFAGSGWIGRFMADSAATSSDALIAVDLERELSEESMQVATAAGEDGERLSVVGKVGVKDPVGEYVGMLMAGGPALSDFRRSLESFEGHPEAVHEWYERAVGLTAASGTTWTVWPTPDGQWVEIDDDDDHSAAIALSGSS